MVKAYARDLQSPLEEAHSTERKAFPHSFTKRIEVNRNEVSVHYKLPLPPEGKSEDQVSVLPIDTFGGAGGTIGRTFSLEFSLARLSR